MLHIIFPAIVQVQINIILSIYIHLVLLHISLLVRVIGDLAELPIVHMWGGMFNEMAILLFLGMTGYSILRRPR